WTEAGKYGVNGLSAVQTVSISGSGNAQHHPREMGANSVKVSARNLKTAQMVSAR
ncbi:Hypothetical predicted protein, partial [Marmota monax]